MLHFIFLISVKFDTRANYKTLIEPNNLKDYIFLAFNLRARPCTLYKYVPVYI